MRSFVGIFFCLVFVAVFYAGYWLPTQREQDAIRDHIANEGELILELHKRKERFNSSTPTATLPPELVWIAPSQSEAAFALQDQTVALAEQNSLILLTFGPSEYENDLIDDAVGFNFEAEGSLVQTYAFIAALEEIVPHIAIGRWQIRPSQSSPPKDGEFLVYQSVTLWAFWGKEQ